MTDPNMSEFYGRVARIEKMRAKGYGFEAAGTLGRSYYVRPKAKRRSILGPILFLGACLFLLKGVIYHQVGPEMYNSRIADLRASEATIDQAGGWVMESDPLTVWIAGKLDLALQKLK